MPLFYSADNTFCNGETCNFKEKCARWIKHYPQLKNHPRLSMVMAREEECSLFIDLEGDE